MRARSGVRRGFERLSDRVGGLGQLKLISQLRLSGLNGTMTDTLIPPDGCLFLFASLIGAGGGGAYQNAYAYGGGGAAATMGMYPNSGPMSCTVPRGGQAATSSEIDGSPGDDTLLNIPGVHTMRAKGGKGAIWDYTKGVAAGGLAAQCVGQLSFGGGSGGSGAAATQATAGEGSLWSNFGRNNQGNSSTYQAGGGGGGGPFGGPGISIISQSGLVIPPGPGGGGAQNQPGGAGAIVIQYFGAP